MAQISAESRNLTALEESFAYTRGIDQIPVRWARREGDIALEDARVEAVRGRPEALAELIYGARMGNDEAGDGYRYRGRGYIQLTGRDNYRAMGEELGLGLEANPGLAAEPENAARIAVAFWQANVPVADREDVLAATRRINGGTNGFEHRRSQYDRWHAVLTPEFIADLDAGRLQPDDEQPQRVDQAAPERGGNARESLDPTNPSHPDHAMYERIRSGVRAIDEANGKPYDETSERISRSLLVRCKGADACPDADASVTPGMALRRVDHVLMGTTGNVFAIEGRLDDPAHRRASVSAAEAALVTVQESDRQLAAVNTLGEREHDVVRQQAAALRPGHPSAGLPCMAG
ncbi:XVIPCD domain-containing protein [Luteimonas sp. MJ246]|uniref:XVIPCD domain-containing protein n=1 Tax=Luteimonas sp. MJ174 TaxID=3129237 RepID=UPI0031BB9BF0